MKLTDVKQGATFESCTSSCLEALKKNLNSEKLRLNGDRLELMLSSKAPALGDNLMFVVIPKTSFWDRIFGW